jgi:hypothetical protein
MANPYREKPPVSPTERADATRLHLHSSSLAFGFCCAVVGVAFAGPRYAPAITMGSIFVLLSSPRRPA